MCVFVILMHPSNLKKKLFSNIFPLKFLRKLSILEWDFVSLIGQVARSNSLIWLLLLIRECCRKLTLKHAFFFHFASSYILTLASEFHLPITRNLHLIYKYTVIIDNIYNVCHAYMVYELTWPYFAQWKVVSRWGPYSRI